MFSPKFTTTKLQRNTLAVKHCNVIERFLKVEGDQSLGNFYQKLFGSNSQVKGSVVDNKGEKIPVKLTFRQKFIDLDVCPMLPSSLMIGSNYCLYSLKIHIFNEYIGEVKYEKIEGFDAKICDDGTKTTAHVIDGKVYMFSIPNLLFTKFAELNNNNLINGLLPIGKFFQLLLDNKIPSTKTIGKVFGALLHTFYCQFNNYNITSPLALHCGKFYGNCNKFKSVHELLDFYSENKKIVSTLPEVIFIDKKIADEVKLLTQKGEQTKARKVLYGNYKNEMVKNAPPCFKGVDMDEFAKTMINDSNKTNEILKSIYENMEICKSIDSSFLKPLSDANTIKFHSAKKETDKQNRSNIQSTINDINKILKNNDISEKVVECEESENSEDF